MFAAMALAVAAVLIAAATDDPFAPKDEQVLEEIKALLDQHDKAFTAHDIKGVLATYAPGKRTVLMGTGPGEHWAGEEEIKDAYEHFFQDFDPGKQDFKYDWRRGGIQGDAAWLLATGLISMEKGDAKMEFVMNISATMIKHDGKWRFVSVHFSNLTGPDMGPVEAGMGEGS
jgi:uncharacterized protein (TIGR02246 family)